MPYTYIDLFSGAGGLSEGFAQSGFRPIAHVEMDNHACKTLETRMAFHFLKGQRHLQPYNNYLQGKIDRNTLLENYIPPQILETILNYSIGRDNAAIWRKIDTLLDGEDVDLIVGGPPCQTYSLMNRSQKKDDDPRNFLYKEYAKFISKYRPKLFVFENVRGIVNANGGEYFADLQSHFQKIGYNLDYTIQNAIDFGVLQNRKRIILIGWQNNLNLEYPKFKKIQHSHTLVNILEDLRPLKPGEQDNVTLYTREKNGYLNDFSLRNGSNFVTQHVARPHNPRDLKIYKIAIGKWLRNKERLKYPDLPEHLKTHKNQSSFLDRFKVVNPDGFSHTIVAHIAKDGHYYIYPDINQIRSISVREAARIQSFPDDYYFEGGRTAAFKQIGNAVPPLMSKSIALSLKELLCQIN